MTSRSQVMPLARQMFAHGALDWATANVKAALIAAGCTRRLHAAVSVGTSRRRGAGDDRPDYRQHWRRRLSRMATPPASVIDSLAAPPAIILFYQDTGNPSTRP